MQLKMALCSNVSMQYNGGFGTYANMWTTNLAPAPTLWNIFATSTQMFVPPVAMYSKSASPCQWTRSICVLSPAVEVRIILMARKL